ncbi:MAG: class I SAM-dependent methyltransferase [Planctomycetes bacterium]|nr:class I SAM-dependent methyltransferase [Planctomycetota bacterium]
MLRLLLALLLFASGGCSDSPLSDAADSQTAPAVDPAPTSTAGETPAEREPSTQPAPAATPEAEAEAEVQGEPEAERPRYITRRIHDPNGIGKFYMGREIAHVMGYGPGGAGVRWLERPQREEEEQLTKLVEALKLKPGMAVADIGAGSGVLTIPIAEKVDPGVVYAVDVQEEMLSVLGKKLEQLGIENVKTVLGTVQSPKLEPASLDLALMVDVYHEFSFPYEMMLELSQAMKPGGRVVFVEYRREDPKVRRMIKLVHTMTEAQVKREMSPPEFGLKWKETLDVLPVQHIIVFEKTGS